MPIKIGKNRFFRLPELKELIGIGVPTIRRYIRDGVLKASKIGKFYIIDQNNLKTFLEEGSKLDPEANLEKIMSRLR